MFDWLYAIPLAILILGSGITYFMPSSLFGPFCIILSIAIVIIMRKRHNIDTNKELTMDDLNDIVQDTAASEKPNAGHCSECNSDWLLSDCVRELEQETWELPPYYIYICPKCKTDLDDYFYEEDEEFL